MGNTTCKCTYRLHLLGLQLLLFKYVLICNIYICGAYGRPSFKQDHILHSLDRMNLAISTSYLKGDVFTLHIFYIESLYARLYG